MQQPTFLDNMRRRQPKVEREVSYNAARCAEAGTNPAYVAAAARRELERLAAAAEGTRNHTLNQVAFALFGFVKSGHVNGPAVRIEMERIAALIGLSSSETQATLRSAWSSAEPRQVPAPRASTNVDILWGTT